MRHSHDWETTHFSNCLLDMQYVSALESWEEEDSKIEGRARDQKQKL